MNFSIKCLSLAAACLSCVPTNSQACATCGCTLNADAAMGFAVEPGWRLSLEYDYIDQDQLRNGTHAISTVPDGEELEHNTLNRYTTLGVDYQFSADWSIDVRVPYVDRSHSTYGTYFSGEPLPPLSYAQSQGLGDIRVLGAYQGILPDHNLGFQFGLKLPTGRYGTDVKFDSGPLAGQPLDASLQPGTGSTDVIIGAYFHQALNEAYEFFATAQFQSAIRAQQDQPGNDFRPGNSTTVSLGVRYATNPKWMPQLQLNLLHKGVDQGALADLTDTAGDVAYLSPGLTAQVHGKLYAYGFAQLPIYSDLVGNQLFPRYTISVGASYAF